MYLSADNFIGFQAPTKVRLKFISQGFWWSGIPGYRSLRLTARLYGALNPHSVSFARTIRSRVHAMPSV